MKRKESRLITAKMLPDGCRLWSFECAGQTIQVEASTSGLRIVDAARYSATVKATVLKAAEQEEAY